MKQNRKISEIEKKIKELKAQMDRLEEEKDNAQENSLAGKYTKQDLKNALNRAAEEGFVVIKNEGSGRYEVWQASSQTDPIAKVSFEGLFGLVGVFDFSSATNAFIVLYRELQREDETRDETDEIETEHVFYYGE